MQTSNSNSELTAYTIEEISEHDNDDDCWIIIDNKVYDVTPYIDFHPGGKGFVLETAGKNATEKFYETPHSDTAKDLLVKYLVGTVKAE